MVRESQIITDRARAEYVAYRMRPFEDMKRMASGAEAQPGVASAISTLSDLSDAADESVPTTEPFDIAGARVPYLTSRTTSEHQNHIVSSANAYAELLHRVDTDTAPGMHTLYIAAGSSTSPERSNEVREVLAVFGSHTSEATTQEGIQVITSRSKIPGYDLRFVDTRNSVHVQAVKKN